VTWVVAATITGSKAPGFKKSLCARFLKSSPCLPSREWVSDSPWTWGRWRHWVQGVGSNISYIAFQAGSRFPYMAISYGNSLSLGSSKEFETVTTNFSTHMPHKEGNSMGGSPECHNPKPTMVLQKTTSRLNRETNCWPLVHDLLGYPLSHYFNSLLSNKPCWRNVP